MTIKKEDWISNVEFWEYRKKNPPYIVRTTRRSILRKPNPLRCDHCLKVFKRLQDKKGHMTRMGHEEK